MIDCFTKTFKLNPKVSVIIPCRNEESYIAKNIDAILSQDYTGELEVIVVDGMSTDQTREIVSQYQDRRVQLIDNVHQFTPQALNLGINHSDGELFIILGGHAFLEHDYVRKCVSQLTSNDELGCVGGQIINIFENEIGEIISKAMSSPFGVGNATFRVGGKESLVDTVAFGAYWKTIHTEIGGFDEELVRNQDDEYNFRLIKAGYKILFDPEIKSHYYVRGAINKLRKQYTQYGYWKVYVNKKHQTITTVRQLIPLFFVLGLILGTLISLMWTPFLWVFIPAIVVYVLMAIVCGFIQDKSPLKALKIAGVFPILHLSYGWGYLVGLIKFILLGQRPSNQSKTSTRD